MIRRNFEISVGICLGSIILVMSLVSFFWTPYDYNSMDSGERFLTPSVDHILGTDNFGRDVFSRIMAGGRNSLFAAVITVAGSALLGSVLGFAAGYLGGITNEVIMRIIDALNSFPGIVLALLFAAVMDTNQLSLFIALLILFVPSYTRVMRTGVLQYKDAVFVKAERIIGAGFFRITFLHILPNIFPSLLSASVIGLSNAILAEASMSYLGMGIQPPEPSWGRMLQESQTFFFNAPWLAIAPGIFIMLTVITFHLLGEGLRRRIKN
jgi:peptide/nickel transport system permease protein